MPWIFNKEKLKPDCPNCDALCCVAPKLDLPHYQKPARMACKHLDQAANGCRIFETLEKEGFTYCRDLDCYGAGPAVTELFRELGKNWINDADIAEVQFHTFSIVYFHLMMYLHPDRALSLDVPEETLEELKPFTDAALAILADTADPFDNC